MCNLLQFQFNMNHFYDVKIKYQLKQFDIIQIHINVRIIFMKHMEIRYIHVRMIMYLFLFL